MDHFQETSVSTSLISGGIAGITVAVLLPLDTCKTRLQSPLGFKQSGGFRGLYKGIVPVLICSGPTAALFFGIYNTSKYTLRPYIHETYYPFIHVTAASVSEGVACLIKVPCEILKQRQQVSKLHSNLLRMCGEILSREGIPGFYRGFSSTIIRDIPFVAIEIPVWEHLKKELKSKTGRDEIRPTEKALCGAVASGTAAAVTTPLDVAKTRVMLAERDRHLKRKYKELKMHRVLISIYSERGVKGLFAGFLPRILWTSTAGIMFFGSYEFTKKMCFNCN